MEYLFSEFQNRLATVNLDFVRYLYHEIDWHDRLIGITGSRGCGKTTLLLQHIKMAHSQSDSVLYLSLDDIYFSSKTLKETVSQFVATGGKYVFLDEVHKYANWSIEIKNCYDSFPALQIVFTGSSILEMHKGQADLSRRMSLYHLAPMSFREFLHFETQNLFPVVPLPDIFANHLAICSDINNRIKPLKYFPAYLKYGAFPFYKENPNKYHQRLRNIVNLVLENDLPSIVQIDYAHVLKIKQLLKIISESVPFKPNILKLAERTGIERKTVLKYLDYLHKAELIQLLESDVEGIALLNKPEKIFLGTTNLYYALNENLPETGSLRETFFQQQLSTKHQLDFGEKADFKIDKIYTIEIGGKSKDNKQIQDLENAFLAIDNLEFGFKNKIPLWLFGFLY